MTVDLQTTYLGLPLSNPFVPSSSPLSRDVDTAKRLEDHGASALVMYSLFEEQLEEEEAIAEQLGHYQDIGHGEASSYLPSFGDLPAHRDGYLKQLQSLKSALDIPVIASLNGTTRGGWVRNAKSIEEAGADALEMNVYYVAADLQEDGATVEQRVIDIVDELRKQVSIPIGVKLSPSFSSVGHLVGRLEQAGANGVALFNRFYQPDVDLDLLEVSQTLHLSNSTDALLAMRWIAILHGRVSLSLAATGGVHTAEDALKMLLCGADVTYLCSTLLANGPKQMDQLREGVTQWMLENEYDSIEQLKGSLSQQHCADPAAFERGNYLKILGSYKVPAGVWR